MLKVNWLPWIAIQLARIYAMWAWSQASELRRALRGVLGTIGIVLLTWFYFPGIVAVIAVQVVLAFQKVQR